MAAWLSLQTSSRSSIGSPHDSVGQTRKKLSAVQQTISRLENDIPEAKLLELRSQYPIPSLRVTRHTTAVQMR